ncbi:MAG: NAD(P)/FAD-dependent oxidoreductase [Bacteriovoracia bacterium]
MEKVDTLVIGAGLVGSSLAMHLARLGASGVRVIDFDLEGSLSSSELNAGGVRATFSQPVNIECSKLSIEYFAKIPEESGYRACGYLWLHGPERFARAQAEHKLQTQMGWPVEVLDRAGITARFPFIDRTEDLAGAMFAPRDGLVNPNLLKMHFRQEGRAAGAVFEDRRLVRAVEIVDSAANGGYRYRIACERYPSILSVEDKIQVLSGQPTAAGERVEYLAKQVVNCAGAWAGEIAKLLKYPHVTKAVRRQVCIFDCRDIDLSPYGMVVDNSGVYFHPEATNGLAGFANHQEPEGFNYAYDGESFFMDIIWPALFERSSKFERLKHLTGWSGLYEVSPDESAIIGAVELGEAGRVGGCFEAHSFSGHGAMHSYAAGLALAEKMLRGRYETLDLHPLRGARFECGDLVREGAVI